MHTIWQTVISTDKKRQFRAFIMWQKDHYFGEEAVFLNNPGSVYSFTNFNRTLVGRGTDTIEILRKGMGI